MSRERKKTVWRMQFKGRVNVMAHYARRAYALNVHIANTLNPPRDKDGQVMGRATSRPHPSIKTTAQRSDNV